MNVEVQKVGWLHWEWRYRSPAYRQFGRLMCWTEYASGRAPFRWAALRDAEAYRRREARERQSWL